VTLAQQHASSDSRGIQLALRRRAYYLRDMILRGVKKQEASDSHFYSQLGLPLLANQNRYGYASISRERRPDLAFEFRDKEDPCGSFAWNAKYRTSRSGVLGCPCFGA